ncbi:GDSL esterase/lipase [Hibiscus syriacus]|uniref:GDSL esterase/lipase n=1 Tax=Hibiscus syriacus TaxID=106335 RepID=A0A6A3A2T8_HIBSY|nr:GDSL esterase/lipase [Hibiscus syriacus]
MLFVEWLAGESLNTGYLTPYLNSLGPNFTNGANFAVIGSSTLPRYVPFSLYVQVSQFLRFRSRSPALMPNGYKELVGDGEFENALYTIYIGQNDLAASFDSLTYSQVIDKIPSFITVIKYAIWSIYGRGGKNFWVHNTGPLGCLPQKLASFPRSASELDEHGCFMPLNNAAKAFNAQLHTLCEQLNSQLINATIVYVDIYSIKFCESINGMLWLWGSSVQLQRQYHLRSNRILGMCGYGGPPYNYNANITCGRTGYSVCHEGSKLVSSDGVHYTEAANAVFASKILSSNYSTPRVNFNFFCNKM